MPDNVAVAIVSGAATVATIATDDVGGVQFQKIKLDLGGDGASLPLVGGLQDTENAVPVVPASGAYFRATTSVAGNVAVVGGPFVVSGAVSVAGNVAASVAGHVLVSAAGNVNVIGGPVIVSGAVSVAGNVAASVAGHVLVSGDGTYFVREQGVASAAVTAQGGGYLVMGTDGASVARFMLTDTVGRQVIAVSGGQIAITGAIFASAQVSVIGNVAASVAGHVLVSADGHALVSGDGSFIVVGNVATDAVDAGNPVKIGGIVVVSANPASAAASDRVNAAFDKIGRQIVVNQHARELIVQAMVTVESANRTILASGGTGIFNDLTHLSITNAAATAVTVYVFQGSAGTPVLALSLPAGGGAVFPFQPPWKQTVSDKVWSLQSTSAASGFLYANVQAVQNT